MRPVENGVVKAEGLESPSLLIASGLRLGPASRSYR